MVVQIPLLGAYDVAAAIAPLANPVLGSVSPRDVMEWIVWVGACAAYVRLVTRFLGFGKGTGGDE